MRICEMSLEGIRSFASEASVPIARGCNVIVGRNNVGKSTLLRMLHWMSESIEPNFAAREMRHGMTSATFRVGVECNEQELAGLLNIAPVPISIHFEGRGAAPLSAVLSARHGYRAELTLRLADGLHTTHAVVRPKDADSHPSFDPIGRTFSLGAGSSQSASFANWSFDWSSIAKVIRTLCAWWSASGDLVEGSEHDPSILCGAQDSDVRATLTYLKMKHEQSGFSPLAAEFHRVFPELSLEFKHITGFEYEPTFVPKSGAARLPVSREAIGSGAWIYLALLTSARAAHVAGASLLLLDEPHLYMHPALERELLAHLGDATKWGNRCLDVLAATHSPEFVAHALAHRGKVHLVQWKDQGKVVAEVRSVEQELHQLGAEATDILYSSRRVVFVEGPSDCVTLECLVPSHQARARYVALHTADNGHQKPFMNAIQIISRTSAGGAVVRRPLLIFDQDKRRGLESAWDKWGSARPTSDLTFFVGKEGSDLESWFCEADLLLAWAADCKKEPLTTQEEAAIHDHINRGLPEGPLKGDQIVERVGKVVGIEGSKPELCGSLVTFYMRDSKAYPTVRENLRPLLEKLSELR